MILETRQVRQSRLSRTCWLASFATLLVGANMASAQESELAAAQPVYAQVTLLGSETDKGGVREVVAELLERADVVTVWTSQSTFEAQELFAKAPDIHGVAAVGVWIDLTDPTEVHLYLRDVHSEWFVIRSLPLQRERGLDELAREEIGHIVASAVTALGTGSGQALTRSEARAVLGARLTEMPATTSPPQPRLELGAWATTQLFAPQQSTIELLSLSFAVAHGPRWGEGTGHLGAWLDLGYQIAGNFRDNGVGVDMRTATVRAGILADVARLHWFFLRLGLGGGVDRVTYRPQGDPSSVDLASGDTFWVPTGRLWSAAELRVAEHVALSLRVLADLALADVHYDVVTADKRTQRVLVPYTIRPGASLGLSIIF